MADEDAHAGIGGATVISYADIITNEPAEPAAKVGYHDLLEAWKVMSRALDSGKPLQKADLAELMRNARRAMTTRELSFFDEPFEDYIRADEEFFQAKVTGRMTKILLDRHGFKVKKEGGGLG